MRIGTKSVLFGVHQFAIHPWLIALGWWKAYGSRRVVVGQRLRERWIALDSWRSGYWIKEQLDVRTSIVDPRLWVAFFVHDVGYLGKPNMDGAEGEMHPDLGAAIMRRLFGEPWGEFVLLHSRYYAKRLDRPVSALCIADKWSIVLEPSWLYLPRAWATGELAEYLEVARKREEQAYAGVTDHLTANERAAFRSTNPWQWHGAVKAYMQRWLAEHADGKPDTWTRVRHPATTKTTTRDSEANPNGA